MELLHVPTGSVIRSFGMPCMLHVHVCSTHKLCQLWGVQAAE